jgi:hypothetical protein
MAPVVETIVLTQVFAEVFTRSSVVQVEGCDNYHPACESAVNGQSILADLGHTGFGYF